MPKYNEITEHICVICGKKKMVQYRPSRSKNWRCQSCGLKKAVEKGKIKGNPANFESKEKLSERAKKLWKDPQYRNKIISSRKNRRLPSKIKIICHICEKEYEINRRYSKSKGARSCQSCAMKIKWDKKDYKDHISNISSINNKKLWNNQDYRDKVTQSNSKTWSARREELSLRALDLWAQKEYRNNVEKSLSKPETKEKIAEIVRKRWLDPRYRQAMAIIRANQPRISSLQTMLYKYLDNLNVKYFPEGQKTAIGYYAFDCLIPNTKSILIECQGDYWHSQSGQQRLDRAKFTYISRYFPEYEIMYIWEHEFYTKDRVIDRLKIKLGIDLETVDFNFKDVLITTPNSKEIKCFLDSYHYIGKGRGGKTIGAYINGELIACCVFSPPVRQNLGYSTELSRFCIHPSYHKKNFASWFMSKALKYADSNDVVAYADNTIGHTGTIYKAAGFEFSHEIPPDYWYVDKDGYVMKKKKLYQHARSLRLTENEFANKNGYLKKYGGPKYCYVKRL